MPIDPERVKLESELFDLDQQLGSIDYSTHFSSSEKVLRKGYLQYQRRKKCLQLTILQEKAMIERLEQDLEVARTNYAQTRTPEGMRARLKREMRQQRGMALRGRVYKRPGAFERLTPEERVIKRAEGELRRAEYELLAAQNGHGKKSSVAGTRDHGPQMENIHRDA